MGDSTAGARFLVQNVAQYIIRAGCIGSMRHFSHSFGRVSTPCVYNVPGVSGPDGP